MSLQPLDHNAHNRLYQTSLSTIIDKSDCRHMDIAIKHPVPDRVKPSFVIFNIWAL